MSSNILFKKTGRQLAEAINNRIAFLEERLSYRNQALDDFLNNKDLVRSYIVRTANNRYEYPGLQAIVTAKNIRSEQIEEIRKIAERVNSIEQEIRQLQLMASHLNSDEEYELTFDELIAYGFEANRS